MKNKLMQETELSIYLLSSLSDYIVKYPDVNDAIQEVISFSEKHLPHKAWSKLRGINYSKMDIENEWLQKVLKNEPIPLSINGLYFGLFNPMREYEHEEIGYTSDLYIGGTSNFDTTDPNYSFFQDLEYLPLQSNAFSKIIHHITTITLIEEDSHNFPEYILSIVFTVYFIFNFFNNPDNIGLMNTDQEMFIACGFDSGDIITIGKINSAKFEFILKI